MLLRMRRNTVSTLILRSAVRRVSKDEAQFEE
jgi:hypothetical protein